MFRPLTRPGLAALALTASLAGSAQAQFQPGANPYAGRLGGLGGPGGVINVNPAAAAVGIPPVNPYGGGLGLGAYYANPFAGLMPDPYGGYLRGSADVINAQGQFMKARQEAALLREQVRQAKLDTYRRTFDQWKYIRENTPTQNQIDREFRLEQVKRSLNDPPRSEIYSAKALNDLLMAFDPNQLRQANVPEIALDSDGLKHINVGKGGDNGTGNIGLLRDGGRLVFPKALNELAISKDRKQVLDKLNALSQEAYGQAANGRVDAGVLKEMTSIAKQLTEELTGAVREFDFSDYSDAKKFLRNLDDAIAGLSQPDAGKMLAGAAVTRAKTASELVQNMLNSGYFFAPAVSGDEAAYQALHGKLASLYKAMNPTNQVSTTP